MPDAHVCDACRPLRDELDAIRARERQGGSSPDDVRTLHRLEVALGICRETMCDGHPDYELPPGVRPGGEYRRDYLEHRVEPSSDACSDIAEYASLALTQQRLVEHKFRSLQQLRKTGADFNRSDYTYLEQEADTAAIRAEEAMKLLRRCEDMNRDPLTKASETLGDALIDGQDPWTETPHDPPPNAPRDEPGVAEPTSPAGRVPWKILIPLLGVLGLLIVVGVVTIGGGSGDADTTPTTQGRSGAPEATGGTPAATDGDAAGDVAGTFRASPAAVAARAAVAGRTDDPDGAVECVGDGLSLAGVATSEIEAMGNPDVATWPSGLADVYAGVLEVCVPLEPYYLGWFGSYDFQDDSCVRTMTDYVLADYSWRRFLDDGILDDDLRPQLQAEFDGFVNEGYGATACFAAAG